MPDDATNSERSTEILAPSSNHPADAAVDATSSPGASSASSPDRKKSRRQGQRLLTPPPANPDAYSIQEFCRAHRISVALFHLLRADGRGLRVMHVAGRVLISREAAAEWRRARERAAMKATAKKKEEEAKKERRVSG
jgi:hypothetical protein